MDSQTLIRPSSPAEAAKRKRAAAAPAAVNMDRVAALILGGGQGTRLFPLTATRSKPAISFGGRYRLIDVPISNCIHSNCRKIFVITQFLSSSLHQHVCRTYRFDSFSSGFIELLPAEQRPTPYNWFQGTADAVRQNTSYFIDTPADYFLILSGDQLYNMDFQRMVDFAQQTDADLVIAALPVAQEEAGRMGILKVDRRHAITEFCEKPQQLEQLELLRSPEAILEQCGQKTGSPKQWLGSMGIYLFKRQALLKLLQSDLREDFGRHLIPTNVAQGNTFAYLYNGYWEDIGTIASFYNANMALTAEFPAFDCFNENRPIYAQQQYLGDARFSRTCLTNSIVCNGSIVYASEVTRSILGPRSVIGKDTVISDCYVMGNDFYTSPIPSTSLPADLSIGSNCFITKSIIDKHVHIGKNVRLTNDRKLQYYDSPSAYIRDGIIVVPRGATLPDDFVL